MTRPMKDQLGMQMNAYQAARAGDLHWFKSRSMNGTLPDLSVPHEDINGSIETVLDFAAGHERLEVVKWLIEDSNVQYDFFGDEAEDASTLYNAMRFSFTEVAIYLNGVLPMIQEVGLDNFRDFMSRTNNPLKKKSQKL